jgi:hypothetical protein
MSAGEVRTVSATGGEKGVKPERFDLMPWDALEEVARCYHFGTTKYAPDNWLRGYEWRKSLGAAFRHLAKFALGEDRDPESGCLHVAHAAWHCLTLATFFLRKLGTDDRAKRNTKPKVRPEFRQKLYVPKGRFFYKNGGQVWQTGSRERATYWDRNNLTYEAGEDLPADAPLFVGDDGKVYVDRS